MPPSSSRFSFATSVTTSPFRTTPLPHRGPLAVDDTTYLGRPFNRSAHAPSRDSHRSANHSSLRRPSSSAAVPSASSNETLPHSSRSLPPYWPNQPPRRNPSLPSGAWTTPSSETFVLITIFPISVSPVLVLSATTDVDAAPSGKWARTDRPVRASAGVHTRWTHDEPRGGVPRSWNRGQFSRSHERAPAQT